MRKLGKSLCGLGVLVALCSGTARAEGTADKAEKPWSLDVVTGFYSDYMFRGFNLYDGTSIQPSSTLNYDTGYGTLSGSLWMHLSAEGDRQEEKFTEMDETVAYAIDLSPVALKVGHVWYTYPDDSDDIKDSAEFFATVALDDSELSPFALTPTLTYYYDYREYDAHYYELGFSHNVEVPQLGEGFNFTPFVAFGFASSAKSVYEDDGLVQVTYGVSTSMNLGDVVVSPTFNYTSKVDDATVNEFWFGTNVTYSF